MKSREDHELNKFTEQSQVKITGHGASRTTLEYDGNNNLTLVKEYNARRNRDRIQLSDINNNEAFYTFGQDGSKFYIWFNVDGAGVDPNHTGTGVSVAITSSDSIDSKTQAIVDAVNADVSINTKVRADKITSSVFTLSALDYGTCSATVDIDAGIDVITRPGTDFELVAETRMSYNVNNCVTETIRIEH